MASAARIVAADPAGGSDRVALSVNLDYGHLAGRDDLPHADCLAARADEFRVAL